MKTQEMYDRIKKHGEQLKIIFQLEAKTDPIALCKKLRRIEAKTTIATTAYCNGDIDEIECDAVYDKALADCKKLLGSHIPIMINRDPRGYALKIDDGIMRDKKLKLYQDWGGYGIIAPDLRQD